MRKGAEQAIGHTTHISEHESKAPTETAMRPIDEETEPPSLLTLQWKFERNAATRICQIPTEILCRIFMLVRRAYEVAAVTGTAEAGLPVSPHERLPYQFLWIFVTTHVCRHWRTAALNEPALWTRPTLFLPNLGKLMLQRARMAGLFIQIEHTEVGQESMNTVLQHMSHTKEFDVGTRTLRALQRLFFQLPSAAPMLESLIIRYCVDKSNTHDLFAYGGVTVPTSLFGEVTSLRALALDGISIQDWNSPHFDRLTSLSLHNIPQDRWPSLVQFKAMLSRMPHLTDLVLRDMCPSSEGLQEQIYLPNLKTLLTGNSPAQVKAVYEVISIPPKLDKIDTCFVYSPEVNLVDMFSTAKRAHLPDVSDTNGLRLEIHSRQGGVLLGVTTRKDRNLNDDGVNDEDEDDDDTKGLASMSVKCSSMHPMSTREAAAHQQLFIGIMSGLDWTDLRTLLINFKFLTPEILRSSLGSLPRLENVILQGEIAVPFIHALHSGWDIDPETEPSSLAFARLMKIGLHQVKFSFDEDAKNDLLALDLLQDCLMGRCERGVAIDFMKIMVCEGICANDVVKLSHLVPRMIWDEQEIGFDTDESSE